MDLLGKGCKLKRASISGPGAAGKQSSFRRLVWSALERGYNGTSQVRISESLTPFRFPSALSDVQNSVPACRGSRVKSQDISQQFMRIFVLVEDIHTSAPAADSLILHVKWYCGQRLESTCLASVARQGSLWRRTVTVAEPPRAARASGRQGHEPRQVAENSKITR